MPRRTRIFWKLFPGFLLVIVLAVAAIAWHGTKALRGFYTQETQRELLGLARFATERLLQQPTLDASETDVLCKELGEHTGKRLTVLLASGTVMGDSSADPRKMENHAARPEVQQAMRGTPGVRTRFSRTIEAETMYVAVPIKRHGDVIGVVRASQKLTSMHEAVRSVYRQIALGGVFVAALAAAIILMLARRLTRPLADMRLAAERFAGGHFEARMQEPDSVELGEVARAMNRMAEQLAARIEELTRQRNEVDAILRGMTEGVFAVDQDERLITINKAAVELLDSHIDTPNGRNLREVVRNSALQQLVGTALESREPVEGEILLYGPNGERCMQVHVAALQDARNTRTGAVVVLNDITRIRRLETLRKDFVANVSHELRTPVTSLKGFVETLLDGAMDEPENARRFLEIIAKHTEQLEAIIDDLLLLCQAENSTETAAIELAELRVRDVVDGACQTCASSASEKNIPIQVTCPDNLVVRGNARMLQQVVTNLLSNAVNYSQPASRVVIDARIKDREVTIDVIDQGCGIPKIHLPRIFERFYRVDKARSRDIGGTGLGLAIVKHLVQAHGGRITVESEVGSGSTFTVHLPVKPQKAAMPDDHVGPRD